MTAIITEQQNSRASKSAATERFNFLKRLLLAMVFGLPVPVLYFYDLIPNLVRTKYVLLLDACICFGILLLRPKPGLMRTAAMLASCTFSLVAMDLALRPAITRHLLGPPELFMYYWPPMSALWRYGTNVRFHSVISGDLAGISHSPYQEKRIFDFETDAFGFRNYPSQVDPKQGKDYDLILLGDSMGAGAGTTQEKTWGTLFYRKYGLRTYNLSIPGSSPWHELMNLKIACHRLHCGPQTTVLWALFAGNDLDDDYGDELAPSLSETFFGRLRTAARTYRNMSPIRNLVERIRLLIHDPLAPQVIVGNLPGGKKLLFRRVYIDATQRTYEQVRQHPHYPKLVAVLREMKRYADAEHFKVYVVFTPAKEEVYRWVLDASSVPVPDTQESGFARAVEERCQLEGLPFLDLKPLLVAEANREFTQSGRLLWWSDDTHWNENGHEYVAGVTYRFLFGVSKQSVDSPQLAKEMIPKSN